MAAASLVPNLSSTARVLAQIAAPITATFVGYSLFHAFQIWYRDWTSPLHGMKGPPNPSWLLGNFREMNLDFWLPHRWRQEYGRTFLFRGLFSIPELHVADVKALSHIMAHGEIYERSDASRAAARRLLGSSLITLTAGDHHRQRRIMNPAFGVPQIRAITEIFVEKSNALCEVWSRAVDSNTTGTGTEVEVLSGLRQMTLDVIGLAGFGYDFDALQLKSNKSSELNDVFTELFHSPKANLYGLVRVAQGTIPVLSLLPLPGWLTLLTARLKLDRIGAEIVRKSKDLIRRRGANKKSAAISGAQRDILSVLLKANLSEGIPESQRMSDAEVVAQIPLFFLAGHETTSTAAAWIMHCLSYNPLIQAKLRAELLALDTSTPTMDELNRLPYLEAVIRETLRLHAPVVFVQRTAMQDDVLPLGEAYVDKQGREFTSLGIRKGQTIHIPIWAVNNDPEIWGSDVAEFKPERWTTLPDAVNSIPGIWANLLTFAAGPHNCIGFRFSLAELKILLFAILRTFEISPALPEGSIGPVVAGLLQRPAVISDKEAKGSGLPVILKRLNADEEGI
ncbi:Cytochrome P450 [Mycena chlorophos]|uniref:Cytochrome P450 n=1 Tax=Mycena chlorophos TaxID=658473 RepID=A0A8H6SY47_MYCCL|nr:Cytochrome P450 [Mycena chlorophos]